MAILRRRTPAAPASAPAAPVAQRRRVGPTKAPQPVAQPKAKAASIRSVDTAEEAAARGETLSDSDSARIVARYMSLIRNPMSAIRARCVQCCNGQPHEVRRCNSTECALHPFRMGENPYNKKVRDRLAKEAEASDDSE